MSANKKLRKTTSRREFLASAAAAGVAGACGSSVAPIVLKNRSAADVTAVDNARRDYQNARATTLRVGDAATSQPEPATASGSSTLFVDVHCHAFNAKDIPIDGFIRSLAQGMGLPPVADPLLAKATRPFHHALVNATPDDGTTAVRACDATLLKREDVTEDVTRALAEQLQAFGHSGWSTVEKTLGALVKTMQTVALPREVLAARLSCTYPEVELFTPALVDFGYWINRNKQGDVLDAVIAPRDQIDHHARVSEMSMRGEIGQTKAIFHPYAAFNPWRHVVESGGLDADKRKQKGITTTFDAIKTAVASQGFVGVKIYPPCGFLPYGNVNLHEFRGGFGARLDAALDELYTWCEADHVPILTHASMGNSFFPDSSWRAGPWGWRHALERHPLLRVCFGHFGNLEGLDGDSDPLSCLAWPEAFLDLMRTYKNVYADISDSTAGDVDAKTRDDYQSRFLYWLCGKLAGKDTSFLATKLLYGSDWWMGVVGGFDVGFLQRIAAMVNVGMVPYTKTQAGAAFAPQFWGANSLRFLGIWDESGNLCKDGTAQRLTARYREVRKDGFLPRWLTPAKAS